MRADLHTHSAASDGQYAPAELVRLAKERGLEILALTDHDSVNGTDEAVEEGRAVGLQIIQGVELSADDYLNLHILGYNFSISAVQGWLESLRVFFNQRIPGFD